MIGRIAVRKPLLRPVNKEKRLKFAQEYGEWTIGQWKSVLWTDESKFERFGSHRRQYVRRKLNERFKPDCIKKIEGIMKKEQYHSILQRHAIPSGINSIGHGFIFQ